MEERPELTMRYGLGEDSPSGATSICSMSRSWGLRGGSCGNDCAGGSPESTRTFSRAEITDEEKTRVSLGSVHIYKGGS